METEILLTQFLEMYDNWDSPVTINDNNLDPIWVYHSVMKFMDDGWDLTGYKVVAFGIYDQNELTIRVVK